MTQVLWRIAADTKDCRADDLTGRGAEVTGGRWNAKGRAVLYTSTTRALACLETVVHLNARGLPLNRYLAEVTVPTPVWEVAQRESQSTVPVGWDAAPASLASIDFGTDWIIGMTSVLLVLPSVIIPEDSNVLINPAHAHRVGTTCRTVRKWSYDPRLIRSRAD